MASTWDQGTIPNQAVYDHQRDIAYTQNTSDPMRTLWLSRPQRAQRRSPIVVWFHGGGLVDDKHECPEALYDGRLAVAEVRHRISPAVKAPAYYEDAAAAVAWVLRHAVEHGADPERVFVGGMSAGAHLAALVCMDPKWLAPYGFTPQDMAGLLLISGQMTTHFQVKEDVGCAERRFQPTVDELSPLSHLSPDLPPMLLVTGDPVLDIPARPEENAFMAASLRAMGHPLVECHHLSGHDHGGAFRSCGPLLERFLARLLDSQSQ